LEFSNSFLIQWENQINTKGTPVYFTFLISYTAIPFAICSNHSLNTTYASIGYSQGSARNITITGFDIKADNNSIPFSWIALGY